MTACANVKREPADDGYDTEQVYGGDGWGTTPPKLEDQFLNRQIAKLLKKKPAGDDEIKARLERLENQQNGTAQPQPQTQTQTITTNSNDITAPPVGNRRSFPNTGGTNWQNSTSYQEWKNEKAVGSSDYKEFQEYKEWLEFKKLKEQNK